MSKILPIGGKAAPASPATQLNPVAELLGELRAGRMVIVMDDEDRENEGDLIMAAEHATAEAVAFMIRHTSGTICGRSSRVRAASSMGTQMMPLV